jgi:short-subunit dehydrogenase
MSSRKKRVVIIGATSSIAEHCARLWVSENAVDLILVGRDFDKTELVAADLRVRSPESNAKSIAADFVNPAAIKELVDGFYRDGVVDLVLIAHGSLPDQQLCQADLNLCQDAITVNGLSPVLFAEAFAGHMQVNNTGTLAIIGSVAGERGRKSNYVYGAAKGLLTRYVQGLQHRLAHTLVKVVLIKPGPTDTPMTAHLKQQGAKLARPESVANGIVQGIKQGKAVIYVPGKWALIMMIIRHLPAVIFNRLEI